MLHVALASNEYALRGCRFDSLIIVRGERCEGRCCKWRTPEEVYFAVPSGDIRDFYAP